MKKYYPPVDPERVSTVDPVRDREELLREEIGLKRQHDMIVHAADRQEQEKEKRKRVGGDEEVELKDREEEKFEEEVEIMTREQLEKEESQLDVDMRDRYTD